jgi:hypothetical protein
MPAGAARVPVNELGRACSGACAPVARTGSPSGDEESGYEGGSGDDAGPPHGGLKFEAYKTLIRRRTLVAARALAISSKSPAGLVPASNSERPASPEASATIGIRPIT